MIYFNRNYYNRNNEKFIPNNYTLINNGNCAMISYNGTDIFKEYFSDTAIEGRLNQAIFDTLKSIDSPYLIKIYDIYKKSSLIERKLGNKISFLPFIIDAYTAEYYKEDSINILEVQKDYILDNFNEIEKLFNLFTSLSIVTNDVKRGNTVLQNDKIIIIDPDQFRKSILSNKLISIHNKKKLLNLFRSLCINIINKYDAPEYSKMITTLSMIISDIEITEKTNITNELSKSLKHTKKVIDLFKNN